MATFLGQLKTPSFWISLIGIVGAVGAGLTDSGNPQLIAVGAILTGVYTLAEHLKDGIAAAGKAIGQGTVTAAQQTVQTTQAALPPFYQADVEHPANKT